MKTINIFSFSELSDDAKKTAIKQLETINLDYDWWDSLYRDAKEIGLKITGFDLDRAQQIDIKFIEFALHTAELIVKEHGEGCDTHQLATKFINDRNNLFKTNNNGIDIYELETEFLENLGKCYLKMLSDEYEYRYTEEAIIETIESNEYYFLENGKMI
jgi:hypothetical protein